MISFVAAVDVASIFAPSVVEDVELPIVAVPALAESVELSPAVAISSDDMSLARLVEMVLAEVALDVSADVDALAAESVKVPTLVLRAILSAEILVEAVETVVVSGEAVAVSSAPVTLDRAGETEAPPIAIPSLVESTDVPSETVIVLDSDADAVTSAVNAVAKESVDGTLSTTDTVSSLTAMVLILRLRDAPPAEEAVESAPVLVEVEVEIALPSVALAVSSAVPAAPSIVLKDAMSVALSVAEDVSLEVTDAPALAESDALSPATAVSSEDISAASVGEIMLESIALVVSSGLAAIVAREVLSVAPPSARDVLTEASDVLRLVERLDESVALAASAEPRDGADAVESIADSSTMISPPLVEPIAAPPYVAPPCVIYYSSSSSGGSSGVVCSTRRSSR